MVRCTHLSKVFLYPEAGKGVFALRDLNLSIEKNEFVCLVGPSGCGKTTLLHMIAGFERPTEGEIRVNGRRVDGPSPERGVVFQEFSLFPWKTVMQNVEFGLKAQGVPKAERRRIARFYLELVGLRGFDQARPHELSGGMKQKVAIARTLALNPDILLMDEPFGSLDEQTRNRLDFELLGIWERERKTVVFVTHCIEEAVLLADRILLFTKRPGRIQMEIRLDMPRPRNIFGPEVSRIRKQLLENLMLCCPPEEGDVIEYVGKGVRK